MGLRLQNVPVDEKGDEGLPVTGQAKQQSCLPVH